MMDGIKLFLNGVGIFFVIYLLVYSTFLFTSVAVGTSVLYKNRRRKRLHNELKHEYYIPISIIVPAYNEEVTVVDTVKSLLLCDYKLFEIIVVDDGSRDRTAEVLIEAFSMNPVQRPIRRQIFCQPEKCVYQADAGGITLTLISKKNGGKADALNMGINASRFPYFICQDADSMLQADALENIIRPVMEDKNVIASGGLIRISNGVTLTNGRVLAYHLPKNLLVCMQILEYDRSFLASRILFDQFNGNLIISGAFGLFKKDIVISAGGYDHDTMGEDMELVVKLHLFCRSHRIPYSIRYAPEAICWSQAPETLKDLRKQRKRWHIGLFQTLWKHRQLFANPEFGLVSVLSFTYYLLYELLSPFIEIFGILTVVLSFWVKLINVPFMVLFFLIYAAFGAVLSVTAFLARVHTLDLKISGRDMLKIISICLLENAGLRFVLAYTRLTAFFGYRRKDWGKIERHKMNLDI